MFIKGYIPWNKGKSSWNKGIKCPYSGENGFKKGVSPWNKGVPMAEKSKEKLSVAKIGKRMSQETKDKIGRASKIKMLGNKNTLGKSWKLSPEILINGNKGWFKKGEQGNQLGKHFNLREKNPNWIFDRTLLKKKEQRNDPAYKEWRANVWKRDGWKCKIFNRDCNGRIEAHHILEWKDFPELRYEVNNGITLCHAHHPRKKAEVQRLIPTFKELVSETNNLLLTRGVENT